MGNIHYISRSNSFWIKNLIEFKSGLKGYVGGEFESPPYYCYEDYKKRSKKALINLSTSDFDTEYYQKGNFEDKLDYLEYIKNHILEGETCVIYLVSYESPNDMTIDKFTVTSESITKEEVLTDSIDKEVSG